MLHDVLDRTCPYRHRDLAEHGDALLDISQGHLLGCGNDNCPCLVISREW